MAFGADDGQTAQFHDSRSQFDIGSTAGHVGGDGHGPELAGVSHDLGFAFMLFGVQNAVRDPPFVKQFR